MGAGLGGVPPSAVAEEKRCRGAGGREVELRRQGRLHVPGVPGGPEGLPREGDGVPADEEGGRRVFRQFQMVPAFPDGEEPVYIAYLTTKVKGGFQVRIVKRAGNF